MNEKVLTIGQVSEKLGVSIDTIRNWDKKGKLNSIRTFGNHRRYKEKDIIDILDANKISLNKMDDVLVNDENKKEIDFPKGNLLRDKVVVYAYICGDILHRGHLLALKNAASLGDFLIVGVLTDEAIMEKKEKPIIPFDERLELVQSLKMVDMAIPQHEYAPHANVKNIKPDILMESTSHSEELINESKKIMSEIGGKVVVFSYYPYQSSTIIKEKIKGKL